MCKEDILKIIDNNPLRLRETYFINNYPNLHLEIVQYTNKLDISFKQRIWHYLKNEDNYILCNSCSNRVRFNRNWLDGYKKYCSPKCAQGDDLTKEKRRKTVLSKYGVDNISKSDDVKKKQESTNLKRYGCKSSFQNEDVRKKWKQNVNKKWGVDHVFQLNDIKQKSKSTSLLKYGTEHFVQSKNYIEKLNEIGFSDKLRLINFNKHIQKYKGIGLEFIEINGRILKLRGECGHEFTINYDSLMRRITNGYDCCSVCNPINSGQSQEEKKLIDWLKSYSLDIIEKDRSIGIELDIFIPSKSLAIEFNGLYWHSELYKESDYHLKKHDICRKNGIKLIHIWEDDWKYRKEIMKSIVLNQLGLTSGKIYSRKCLIKTVSNSEKNEFLDKNHIQGKCNSTINLALLYENEIVSLMTFGWRKMNNKLEFELIRFCNKINTIIIGSASKLFNYFIKNYKFNKIYSFADVSHFNGDLYKNLGFTYIHRTKPNYWWVVDGIRYHRFTYNKKRLVKEGHDFNKTEVEIMYEMGYFRLFGCGQDKYIFNYKN
jgi:hypothetical protein